MPRLSITLPFVALFAALPAPSEGGGGHSRRVIAPVERAAFTRMTPYDSLRVFLLQLGSTRGISVTPVAVSRLGRTVSAVAVSSSPVFGADTAKLRLLLFAQQHGDEASGKEAVTLLLAELASGTTTDLLRSIDLLIVPQMNPDGAEAGRRLTADTLDLNRNHVLLTAPEVRGLHDLFHRWKPHVTLDIHEYDSFSKGWTDTGWRKTGDVQVGTLTNLNVPPDLIAFQHEVVLPAIARLMAAAGYSFNEYIVGTPGSFIRRSTTAFDDGRGSFGVLGTLSFIQEGRKWRADADSLRRRSLAQLAAMHAFLAVCAEHAGTIRALVTRARAALARPAGKEVVLRMEHREGGAPLRVPVVDLRTGRDSLWPVAPFRGLVMADRSITAPRAYVIPADQTALLALLRRHHIAMRPLGPGDPPAAQMYTIERIVADTVEGLGTVVPVVTTSTTVATGRDEAVLVPMDQWHSLLAVLLLEPESCWGVFAIPEFRPLLARLGHYPVLRIP